jgi:hypothetical protein
MVVCKKCGNENPLGRVFCVKCGTKLDLTHMTSEHVVEIQKSWSDPFVKYWPKAAAAVIILAVALVVLALWPTSGVIGKKGTRVDGHRVENAISSLKFIRIGETRNLEFKEEDINGYFEFFKAKTMNMQSVSVSLQDGYLFVRVIQPIHSIPLIKVNFEPVMSYDLVCQPYGGSLVLDTVKFGHLSMFGPLKTSAVKRMYALFGKEPECATLHFVTDIKCAPGKMSFQAKREK